MSEFQEWDSGWTMIRILHIEINVNQLKQIKGSIWLKLPDHISNKGGCINVRNEDHFCFKWAIISALERVSENSNRCNSYTVDNIYDDLILVKSRPPMFLNFTGLSFPLPIMEVKKFEKLNPDISITIFGYDTEIQKVVGPYHIPKEEKRIHINLLLLEEQDHFHYVWIKNLSRVISKQLSDHDGAVHICNTCLQAFQTDAALITHKPECGQIIAQMVDVSNNKISFKNFDKQMDVPFVVYADFECLLTPENNVLSSSVKNIQRHIPCAFSYYIKCSFNKIFDKFVVYSGKDEAKNFVNNLRTDVVNIYKEHLSQKIAIIMTQSDNDRYNQANLCHICGFELLNDRVMDHCHLTGKFRGAAHNSCNLNYKIPKFVPIFFHNFTSYDCHLFIEELSSFPGDINVIPLNKEKCISLSKFLWIHNNNNNNSSNNNNKDKPVKIELRFLDSLRFMSSSLDTLSKNLHPSDLKVTRDTFPNDSVFKLVCKKGIFPYNYITSIDKLDEAQLPNIKEFFNQLTNSECSLEDYEHAQNVWKTFQCKTIRDYMEVYLKTDVLLLTDVFEYFRKVCKSIYNLDPCQYYTAPGLSWDAMLKSTNIELELFTDITMHTFIQRGIRGGLVQCSHRHSIAKNKYLSNYEGDVNSPNQTYLMYLDVNNLYGWAMVQNLPYGAFEWVENVNEFDIRQLCSIESEGYILEVDLDYPENLHDKHNDLPFCRNNKKVSTQVKLIADFNPKEKYIILNKNLKQCLEMGLKLRKIHRVLKFNQSPWLKTYIDLNTTHRMQAKNTFEKDFFKLMNNSVYGKTMENVDKRKNVKIVTNWESKYRRLGARALIAKANFNSVSVISDSMLIIQMNRDHTIYNKPLYLGFCVLETSKLKMYDFHYRYMKPKYEEKVKLNYMDTDSFIYTIETKDYYQDIHPDITQHFDTSEYSLDNPYNIPQVNKKVLGMMKDENQGRIMKEFVGLRSKVYAIDTENCSNIKKSKGVKKSSIDKLTIDSYRDCLLYKTVFHDSMYTFRSYNHKIHTQELKKVILSYIDDKRFICDDGIHTLALGHYINNETNINDQN